MKLSFIRTDKQNRKHFKNVPLETMMQKVLQDNVTNDIENLRDFVERADSWMTYGRMHRIPAAYPSVTMRTTKEGDRQVTGFNGLLTLTVGPLHDLKEAEAVKRMAALLPCTKVALRGSSGKTVKILISASRPNGSLPEEENEMEAFCKQAYPLVCRIYETVIQLAATSERLTVMPAVREGNTSLLMAGFRMTVDPHPYMREETMAINIPENLPVEEVGIIPGPSKNAEAPSSPAISEMMQRLIDLLEQQYNFRMNTMMGYVEYRKKEKWHLGWRPVDERVRNSLAMEARLAGLNVWDKDIVRYLNSGMVRAYNPIEEYLWGLVNKWDGRDYIGALARRVPTKNPHWPQWFRTWFLAMVAQWLGMKRNYGNALVPLLISKQGYNKSTFCKSLIPIDLQWGYTDNLILSEKKSVLQAMSQFLLINLDEFNQISPAVQQGFLKNIIQLASVKVKRPYGRHVEDFPRLASFIATTNMADILVDPSGNRRFIGVELTGPIDVSQKINYDQLYAQAVTLLDQKEPTWLDEEQTRLLMESNRQFQLCSPEEQFFEECFTIPEKEEDGTYLTTAAIFAVIKKKAGSAIRYGNLIAFGRFLSNMEHLKQKRIRQGTAYLVRQK
ncbi:MAG: DUF3874 domain-containing protein [Prevotella sp.]|nr:DUF3874 domain-containing protein [Prevotella sp.]